MLQLHEINFIGEKILPVLAMFSEFCSLLMHKIAYNIYMGIQEIV